MNDPRNGNIRWLLSATLIALPMISFAAEPDTCAVSANPSRFEHQQLRLEGIVTGLMKSTSRSGSKQMTFLLSSLAGCGPVAGLKFHDVIGGAWCSRQAT